MPNSIDPDQLASKKPTDLDQHCFAKAGHIRVQQDLGWYGSWLWAGVNFSLSSL